MHKTSDGRAVVAFSKSDATKKWIFSHDWTDKTTWYTSSVRVTDEALTDTGDHTTYQAAHTYLIDLRHGKVFREDYLKNASGQTYNVAVKVDGVTKTEQDPHFGTGGDFTINYVEGKIVFLTPLSDTAVVTATYQYATDSVFKIIPTAGKKLIIDNAEVQFSKDVVLKDSVVFELYGLVDIYAPQLIPAVPTGTMIPVSEKVVYKSFSDFQAEASKAYPVYPAMGGSNWRASPQEMVILSWDYVAATEIKGGVGLELRMYLEHHTPFDGWYASATFYAKEEPL